MLKTWGPRGRYEVLIVLGDDILGVTWPFTAHYVVSESSGALSKFRQRDAGALCSTTWTLERDLISCKYTRCQCMDLNDNKATYKLRPLERSEP